MSDKKAGPLHPAGVRPLFFLSAILRAASGAIPPSCVFLFSDLLIFFRCLLCPGVPGFYADSISVSEGTVVACGATNVSIKY